MDTIQPPISHIRADIFRLSEEYRKVMEENVRLRQRVSEIAKSNSELAQANRGLLTALEAARKANRSLKQIARVMSQKG